MIIRTLTLLVLSVSAIFIDAQVTYEVLAPCPEKISNTAVAGITIFGRPYVYSFAGIDSSKTYEGIHARSYKFDLIDNEWSVLSDLPGGQNRIAAGASTIKEKIYILGGYEVFENGNEVSLNQLHIFDPVADVFLADAAPMPTPIDDHVQVVYKDSLLYSITGWSNNGNVNEVWMYNPEDDAWSECTSLPLGPVFSSFGSSGSIIGDTIYFLGGASEIGPFNLSDRFRKGYINPDDPTQIEWIIEKSDYAIGYRMGACQVNDKVFWLGGSQTSYNYDGVAYNGIGGVSPTSRLLLYDPTSGGFTEIEGLFPEVMDLRGLAQVGPTSYVSVGGMIEGQELTNRVVKYNFDPVSYISDYQALSVIDVKPNPASRYFIIDIKSDLLLKKIEIFDSRGELIFQLENPLFPLQVDCSLWTSGVYYYNIAGARQPSKCGSISILK